MIADPPSLTGAVHETVTTPDALATASTFLGAEGVLADELPEADVPTALVAVTTKSETCGLVKAWL